jgi:integrase
MGYLWQSTSVNGIRFREHEERKHGVKKDRFYQLRYMHEGQRFEESLGWASQGWTLEKAMARLAEIKENIRLGQGPQSLKAKRALAKAERQAEQAAQEQAKLEGLTFGQFFTETYFPQAERDKSPRSAAKEEQTFRLWLAPVIGGKPFKDISPFDLERIKQNMGKAARAARSIHYALAIVRQIFNHARRLDIYTGDNPVRKVKKPVADNRRMRFLTREEGDLLLEALAEKSADVHDIALTSLYCGLRAGEIFKLVWADVDLTRGTIYCRDTKSGRDRTVPMPERVVAMLKTRGPGQPAELVFPGRGGKRIVQISDTFNRVVNALGFNDGVDDPRQRIVFHSMRHSYASQLAERGVDMIVLRELLGHHDMAMTLRYSHLQPDRLRAAVDLLDEPAAKTAKVVDMTARRR